MTIKDVTTADLATICAGLATQGAGFKARPDAYGNWTITLTGAY